MEQLCHRDEWKSFKVQVPLGKVEAVCNVGSCPGAVSSVRPFLEGQKSESAFSELHAHITENLAQGTEQNEHHNSPVNPVEAATGTETRVATDHPA